MTTTSTHSVAALHDYPHLYIGGRWRAPVEGGVAEAISPVDGRPNGSTPIATPADVDVAVEAARGALADPQWAGLPVEERAGLLEEFAGQLQVGAEQRAALTSVQNGMPYSLALASEALAPVGLLRYHAGLARAIPVEDRRPRVVGGGETVVRREPVGVVGVVVPWTFPQAITMFKVAPALAAGCSVVLKPSPATVFYALEIAAAADRAGLPPGVLNVVTGGAQTGAHLVAHPGVDQVAFTGSTATGRKIAEIRGRLLRPVLLELSGRSAGIMLDDVDLSTAVPEIVSSALRNSGQTCYAATRILAPRARYPRILEALAAAVDAVRVGDPFDPATEVGPLVSRAHRDRVTAIIATGRQSATLVTGGDPAEQEHGWFVRPALFDCADPHSRLCRDEILGPVLTVSPYDDESEAVAIANDSDYGLSGTVWTADAERGLALARRVESGTFAVNHYDIDLGAPYGGIKDSGLGRELGPEGFSTYQRYKSIYLDAE